jgi:PGF-CTERM protein
LSANFSVAGGQTSSTSVIIFTQPKHIDVMAIPTSILADGSATCKIAAYVTDAFGDPVSDGFPILIILNNSSPFVYAVDDGRGAFTAPPVYDQYVVVATSGGWANTSFGWATENYAATNASVNASYFNDPLVNDTVVVYFMPVVSSWWGAVVDSFNNGIGDATVMIHVMGWDVGATPSGYYPGMLPVELVTMPGAPIHEIYNLTTKTSSSLPFVGSYTFDNIVLLNNVTHAFTTVEYAYTDNRTIYGMSYNYSLGKGRTSAGSIVLHVPMPDGIDLTASPNPILVGGYDSLVTAQLYLNGLPYKRSNVKINFSSDNNTVGNLVGAVTVDSDANGRANITLRSNQTVGWVNVTGNTSISFNSVISDSVLIKVVGWGTVSGIVTDRNKNGIPGATVTLWVREWNASKLMWVNVEKADVAENPQDANDGRTAAVGMYTYEKVPWGLYNVTAEKDGHIYFAFVNLTEGTYTANVAIPDFVYNPPPPVATPTPTPGPTVAPTVAPTPTPTPKPTPGFELVFALAGLLGVAYLVSRKKN